MQNSLLQPVRQWRAHENKITSVEGANFRGKLDLLVTAGVDCLVHLWTVTGAHVGTFGQVCERAVSSMIFYCFRACFMWYFFCLQLRGSHVAARDVYVIVGWEFIL